MYEVRCLGCKGGGVAHSQVRLGFMVRVFEFWAVGFGLWFWALGLGLWVLGFGFWTLGFGLEAWFLGLEG